MRLCGAEQIDDVFDRFVGLVVGGLEFGVRTMGSVGFVMKATVGQWSAEALVKEEKQECDLDSLGGEVVAVTGTVTLKQAVAFQLAEIIAELV